MYIIAIGWLYVAALVAAGEPSVIAGIISFVFLGLLPCSLVLWLGGSKVRRQRRQHQELLAEKRRLEAAGRQAAPESPAPPASPADPGTREASRTP